MRRFFVRWLSLLAVLTAPLAAQTPTPTPGNAVDPSDQSAVAPALPVRAGQPNSEVSLGASAPQATPAPAPFSAPPELVPLTTTEELPTISSPPISAAPAAGSAHARGGVVSAKPIAVSHGAASTVTGYQKGKSLIVKTPAGSLVEYRLGKDTILPDDLGPGRHVLVETKIVKKRRVATRVSYAEGRVVLTNVN
ncbi:MAG: hypothetical protein ACHQM4_05745 [Thermoanaerobaculia bacterium]